ncbi:MAG TPA: hypothetical protein EYO33_20215 [Phycisphaerales bacterium]|nr:hypothetical protein [Phycisphaerales bacterium]
MELQEVVNYLAAAAAADAPIDGRERDLMDHLLQDFGATHNEASKLISALPEPFNLTPTIHSLESRENGLKLLRALLVISYCDGTFDAEELPFLEPLVDKFQVRADELRRLKQQALYFLGLRAPSIEIPQELIASGDWDKVCEVAQTQYKNYLRDYQRRFEQELDSADEETCYMALNVGPPTFDTTHARNRFLQGNPDFLHLDDAAGLQMLRDNAEKRLRDRWEAAYSGRCNFCYLEAPGRRRDPCPRCGKEYGEAAHR